MTGENVLGYLAAPDRESSLLAISLAILRVRANHRLSYKELAKMLGCSADTVEGAANEKSMLTFDSIARLGYFFPDEFEVVCELWGRGVQQLTVADRVERIERELAAIRRETVA